jgi:hypothetical protein
MYIDIHVYRCTKLSLWEPTVDLGVFSRNKVGILRLYIIHRYMYIDRHVYRCTKLSLWEYTVDLGVFSRKKVGIE